MNPETAHALIIQSLVGMPADTASVLESVRARLYTLSFETQLTTLAALACYADMMSYMMTHRKGPCAACAVQHVLGTQVAIARADRLWEENTPDNAKKN